MRDVWQQIRNGGHPGFEEGASVYSTFCVLEIFIALFLQYGLSLRRVWNSNHLLQPMKALPEETTDLKTTSNLVWRS